MLRVPVSFVCAALLVAAIAAGLQARQPVATGDTPVPQSVDQFRAAVAQVLRDTGVPGAGIALVRSGGIEWAGGVGLADRDAGTPVTASTHFRAGSISKTFVAMALVQQSLDGAIDLQSPVADIAPALRIDNPWDATSPVRVIHLLQHTAGFDDMHFTEMYNLVDAPNLPLVDVLRIAPASRRVRWEPGTRMSYSNPGYAVAGYVLERVTEQAYEDVITRRIFDPLGMHTSSFVLTPSDESLLAKGYDRPGGPAVPYSQIYLRPAGNLHTSAAELGSFVQMLLNWGETTEHLVVDPEYLGNMEQPLTSLAARAGMRYGYGTGISALLNLPYLMLGHNGGIDGFSSSYAYSTARDVGFVVLTNAAYGSSAITRISTLAIRYLKAGIEPHAKPTAEVAAGVLSAHAGYYHDEGPRNQVMAFADWLTAGRTITVEGDTLYAQSFLGPRTPLVPVSATLFRREADLEASRAFTKDSKGEAVLTGMGLYAVRTPRWRVELVRAPVLVSVVLMATVLLAAPLWFLRLLRRRRAQPHGFWLLKLLLVLATLSVAAFASAWLWAPARTWGTRTLWTSLTFFGSTLLPVAALLALAFAVDAWRRGAGPWLRSYALLVAVAGLIVSSYLWHWGMLGFRPWLY